MPSEEKLLVFICSLQDCHNCLYSDGNLRVSSQTASPTPFNTSNVLAQASESWFLSTSHLKFSSLSPSHSSDLQPGNNSCIQHIWPNKCDFDQWC